MLGPHRKRLLRQGRESPHLCSANVRGTCAMPRLFTALEIPAEVGRSLAMLRGGLPGARWIDPENYHLTLRFIGDIDDGLPRGIAFMVATVSRLSFELRLDGPTSFGARRPRAVVAAAART